MFLAPVIPFLPDMYHVLHWAVLAQMETGKVKFTAIQGREKETLEFSRSCSKEQTAGRRDWQHRCHPIPAVWNSSSLRAGRVSA